MKKVIKWFLYSVLAIMSALLLFHSVENFRGKRAWEAWRRSREALGDRYDWNRLLPSAVPDEQNFAKAPCIASVFVSGSSVSFLDGLPELSMPEQGAKQGDWQVGRAEDLEAWRIAFNTPDLLAGLKPFDVRLNEIAEAARRPECQIPAGSIPSLLGLRRIAMLYKVRALVRIAEGKPEQALDDIQTCLRMVRHLDASPVLVTAMLQNAILRVSLQAIWEGLEKHCWNERQLTILQQDLSRIDLLVSWQSMWQGERLFSLDQMESGMKASSWERARGLAMMWPDIEASPSWQRTFAIWSLVPKGWTYQNQRSWDQACVEQLMPAVDPSKHRFDPSLSERFAVERSTPWAWIMETTLPAVIGQQGRFARIQTALDQALVVCGLERYRLAKGSYPESLEFLIPQFAIRLPTDVVSGGSLHYHRIDPQAFQLYAIGWNGQDDDGKLVSEGNPPRQILSSGDWSWMNQNK